MVGPSLTTEMSIVAAGSLLSVVLAGSAWRRRPKTGATALTVMLVGVAAWLGAIVASAVAPGYALSMTFERLSYAGQVTVIACWVAFALEYTGEGDLVTRRTVALLSVEPILVSVFVWTNPWHSLFWTSVDYDPGPGYDLSFGLGPANWAHAAYSYLLVLAAIVLLIRMAYRARRIHRRQALLVMLAVVLPLLTSVNQLVDLPEAVETVLDAVFPRVPVAFAATGIVLSVAMFRYGLVDAGFVAHRTIVDSITDGEFVVDRDDRIVEMNARARELLGVGGAVVGQPAASVLDRCPEVRERYRSMTAGTQEFAVESGEDQRFLELQVGPLTDGRERRQGRLYLVRDVTDRRRRERELERQKEILEEKNEELKRQKEHLDKFTSIVSHDLRNPLNAAKGYADLTRETGDLAHLGEVEDAHDRMDDLIEQGLALARRGETITDTEWVNLATIASAAWKTIDTHDATLTVDTDAVVRADRARLRQIFENLFRNSIEHGSTSNRPAAGKEVSVTVGTIRRDDAIGFYVADDGPGIPPEKREEVFQSGYTTNTDGTGLGLSIVDGIAKAHGWAIRVVDGRDGSVDRGTLGGSASGLSGGARFEITGVTMEATTETSVATARSD